MYTSYIICHMYTSYMHTDISRQQPRNRSFAGRREAADAPVAGKARDAGEVEGRKVRRERERKREEQWEGR